MSALPDAAQRKLAALNLVPQPDRKQLIDDSPPR
jgi:hypothetical protein